MKTPLKTIVIVTAITLTGLFGSSCAGIMIDILDDQKSPAEQRKPADLHNISYLENAAKQTNCALSAEETVTGQFSYGYTQIQADNGAVCGVTKYKPKIKGDDKIIVCCGAPKKFAI